MASRITAARGAYVVRVALWVVVGSTSCAQPAEPPPVVPQRTKKSPEPATPDPRHSLLKNGEFSSGSMLPWAASFTPPASGEAAVKDDALCVHLDAAGRNPWDAQVRHREMTILKDHNYAIQFRAWASRPTQVTPKVGKSGPPYTDYWNRTIELREDSQDFTFNFTMSEADDPTVEFALHLGGSNVQGEGPIDVCFDDLVLANPAFTPPSVEVIPLPPLVRVNQLGYLPKLSKIALFVGDAKQPLEWQLVNQAGESVATGKTRGLGLDPASGDPLHLIDFSKYTTEGRGFQLKVGNSTSHAFDIEPGLYAQLKYDAFKYFYHNRSGIEIKPSFASRPELARPAGHPKDVVPCAPDAPCAYSLDVTGGWYDAGDYGKYVVNGGISVWTLLNFHERTTHLGKSIETFADGKANLPESGNGVPDILDEARWELEFLSKMQVPEGQPLAGMAHHKMHDQEWTALGLRPHESKLERFLRPPSTAATLNLAAVGAQGARIWRGIDEAFSTKLLVAAERAWQAAVANPQVIAVAADTVGGGPYDDDVLDDEFYWAAAELYITTEKPEYRQAVLATVLDQRTRLRANKDGRGAPTAMSWREVDTLAKISLAVVPNKLGVAKYRQQIARIANEFVAVTQREGYRTPLSADRDGKYPWGSNSFVINNLLVLALAHDFYPKQASYLNTVQEGMNYLLGRNALGQSYITGYGDRPLQNPHHRFWAHQANTTFPKAPPGVLGGGPNSGLEDPYVNAAGLKGCAPQKCFVDHIEAWSANECTINWNAPLAWVAAWLDEHGS